MFERFKHMGAKLRRAGDTVSRAMRTDDMIDPKDLMKSLSVEELCATAEEYYRKIPDPTGQMAKPFGFIQETAEMLHKLALLISGLRLGATMTVLDFGAGTCWLSRFLNQMHCATVSVDASRTALEIGRRLFQEMPVLGGVIAEPRFVVFDGHVIDVPDESVDRIACFDTFHHVPNQAEALREFFRVLRWGGIAGFSEPGRHHSRSAQSQYEMRNYRVLENDIILEEIMETALSIGFTGLFVKPVCSPGLDLTREEYHSLTSESKLPPAVTAHLIESSANSTVFFLVKGQGVPDSRSPAGLAHHIDLPTDAITARTGEPVFLDLKARNTGTAAWLHENIDDYGVVKVGTHLYDADRNLLDLDFSRTLFSRDIRPGEAAEARVALSFPKKGSYVLGVDLVAEKISWFENLGSRPVFVKVIVT